MINMYVIMLWSVQYYDPYVTYMSMAQMKVDSRPLPVAIFWSPTGSVDKKMACLAAIYRRGVRNQEFLCFFPSVGLFVAAPSITHLPVQSSLSTLPFLSALSTLGWSCCDITHSHTLPLAAW